jgi:hypothetical protein
VITPGEFSWRNHLVAQSFVANRSLFAQTQSLIVMRKGCRGARAIARFFLVGEWSLAPHRYSGRYRTMRTRSIGVKAITEMLLPAFT